jgi:hypothetical protein
MMNHRHALMIAALGLGLAGLAGCASTPSNSAAYARQDGGSYYSPAEAGNGDYYFATAPVYSSYYFNSYQGFGGGPFFYGFNGWYDPFWPGYGYYGYWPHHGHGHGHAGGDPPAGDSPPTPEVDDVDDTAANPGTQPRRGYRTWRPKADLMADESAVDDVLLSDATGYNATANTASSRRSPKAMPDNSRPAATRRQVPAPEQRPSGRSDYSGPSERVERDQDEPRHARRKGDGN